MIEKYEQLLDITQQMYHMACKQQWQTLAIQEKKRQEMMSQLPTPTEGISQANKQQMVQLLEHTKQLQQYIEQCCQKQYQEEKQALQALHKSKKIKQCYKP